jgi:hypothetical protein
MKNVTRFYILPKKKPLRHSPRPHMSLAKNHVSLLGEYKTVKETETVNTMKQQATSKYKSLDKMLQ